MSDLQTYAENRIKKDTAFADGYQEGYADFKLGVLLRQAREAASFTQADIALQLGTQRATVSKIENHAEDVRLTLLRRYAEVLGKNLHVSLA